MPDVKDFLDAFGLVKGNKLSNKRIVKVTSTHEEIKRYREYGFEITVTLDKDVTSDDTFNFGTHIVNSRYGNPYSCTISSSFTYEGSVLHLVGNAKRVWN